MSRTSLSLLLVVLSGLGLVGLAVTSVVAEARLLREQGQTRRERRARALARQVREAVLRDAQAGDARLRRALRGEADLASVASGGVLVVDGALNAVAPPSPFAQAGPADPATALRPVLALEARDPRQALERLGRPQTPDARNLRARLLVRLGRREEALTADAELAGDDAAGARLHRVALQRRVACLEALGREPEAARERTRLVELLVASGGRGDTPGAVWAALNAADDADARALATRARIAAALRAVGDPTEARLERLGSAFALAPDADGGWLVLGPPARHEGRTLRVVLPLSRAALTARLERAVGAEPEFVIRLTPTSPDLTQTPLGVGLAVTVLPEAGPDALASSRLLLLVGLVLAVAVGGVATWRSLRKAAELARLRADFVASVTHELRTPLASIRSLADVLALGKVTEPEQRAEFLEGIASEARRLTRLVDDVLDVARIERGAFTAELEPGRVEDVVSEVVGALQPLAAQEGYALEVEPLPELPPVLVDRVLLGRALENLLVNAIKYSGDPRRIGVRAAAEDGHLLLSVEDAGVGIPAGERERVFERFVRGSRIDGQSGAGLGLAIVREVMTAHQGSVTLECPAGGGCRFTLRLPVWRDPDPEGAS